MAGFLFNPLTGNFDIAGGGGSLSIGGPVGGSTAKTILVVDASNNLSSLGPLTNGQLVIGSTGNLPSLATLTGTSNQVSVSNGAGSITLSLPQNIHTAASPTFANLNLSPSGVVDITSSGTLAIGTGNATTINIGKSGATVNIQGDTFYQNVTNLQVTDKLITINKGGSTGSASNSGLEIEENSIITAYLDTSGDRNSWELKAPATAGIVTITPGSSGFTINQGSHDPVTIGTANGLSLSTQQLSLAAASAVSAGAVTTGTQTFAGDKTFANGVFLGGNLTLGQTTSNITGTNAQVQNHNETIVQFVNSGLVSVATIQNNTVLTGHLLYLNNNTGNTITLINNYGSPPPNGAPIITGSGINYTMFNNSTVVLFYDAGDGTWKIVGGMDGAITSLTGDVTASGPGAAATTLASVGTPGTYAKVTTDSKGRVTSGSTQITLTTDVTGTLPVANGGTGLSSIGAAHRILGVNGAGTALEWKQGVGINGITVSGGTNALSVTNTFANADDIGPTLWSGLANNTANQVITGFLLGATVKCFEAMVSVRIVASSSTYSMYKLKGVNRTSNWSSSELAVEVTGDVVPGLSFSINSSGQVLISTGNYSGFNNGSIIFRVNTLT